MKILCKIRKIIRNIVYCLLPAVLSGCIADERCYAYKEEVELLTKIDWGEVTDIPEHLKFTFFSTEDEWSYTRYLEEGESMLQVPYGNYRVLFYNWRSNGDVQYIKFEEEETYLSAKIRTDFKKSTLFSEEILYQPDRFFAWSSGMETLTVFKEGELTRSMQVLTIKPVQMVRSYEFFIPATGVQYVKRAEAVLSGVSRYKLLHNQQVTGSPQLVSVDMHPQTDSIRFRFSTFGFITGVENLLTIRFVLLDNTELEVTYPLTREIAAGEITGPFIPIDIPYAEGENSFGDPDIGDWQEVFENIPF